MKVVIVISTYKRPESLARLLLTLPQLDVDDIEVHVVVADNSPALEGMAVASAIRSDYPFVAHPVDASAEPGISSVRNAGIEVALSLEPDYLAFLDDDEWPEPQWLSELIRVQKASGASAVGGPTRPEFPEWASERQRQNPYYGADLGLPDGSTCQLEAAGNFLLLPGIFADLEAPYFPIDFGHSGGEDLAFFKRIARHGHTMAWASKAIVHEPVVPERLNDSWMRKRVITIHNSRVRLLQQHEPGMSASIERAVKTAGLGTVATVLSVGGLFHENLADKARLLRWKFLGKFSAHLGRHTEKV